MVNVGIKDVADHAGVSLATITRVVNNRGYVSAKTRERVQKSIKSLGYIPNRMASALKNKRTGIIGNVVALSTLNTFFSYISVSLKDAALRYNYQILPVYSDQNRQREERLIHELIGRMAEGIIFTSAIHFHPNVIKEVLNAGIPVIMIERTRNISGVDKVLVDDYTGSSLVAARFLEMGHKTIAFIGKDIKTSPVEYNRFYGFKQTLKKSNVTLYEKNVEFVTEYEVEYGYDAMKRIMERGGKNRPSACFLTSDLMVCGALQYLYNARLNVPGDMSLIGYDNTLSMLCSPAITSIAIPYEEIGNTALSMFWERREQNRGFDKTILLSPFLKERGSVRDLRK
ncbi:LacI family transcriptional regulator [Spirochaetia bacterium]|nr:LacI family transcriptional regulator [Spirochaetia bacterium]